MKPVLLVVCDRDPLTVKALAKESKIDPEFRRQMWALVSGRHRQNLEQGRKGGHKDAVSRSSPQSSA